MADTPPPVIQVPAPLTWQIETLILPTGVKAIKLTVTQSDVAVQFALTVDDMAKVSKALDGALTQARTGLIVPGSNGATAPN